MAGLLKSGKAGWRSTVAALRGSHGQDRPGGTGSSTWPAGWKSPGPSPFPGHSTLIATQPCQPFTFGTGAEKLHIAASNRCQSVPTGLHRPWLGCGVGDRPMPSIARTLVDIWPKMHPSSPYHPLHHPLAGGKVVSCFRTELSILTPYFTRSVAVR